MLVALLTAAPPADGGAADLDALLDEVVADAARPGASAFIREVSTLTSAPEVAEALDAREEHRRAEVREAVAEARRTGRADPDADSEVQEIRLRWVIEGFESLVAGGADARALAPQLREMARLALR